MISVAAELSFHISLVASMSAYISAYLEFRFLLSNNLISYSCRPVPIFHRLPTIHFLVAQAPHCPYGTPRALRGGKEYALEYL